MMVFMDEIEVVLPSKDLEMAALEYKKEHFDNQEYELMEVLFLTRQIHMMIG
jgi:hypothetical protein